MDEDNVTEAQCSVCGPWPKSLRPTMREAIDTIPLHEPVCDQCLGALFENFGWLQSPTPR